MSNETTNSIQAAAPVVRGVVMLNSLEFVGWSADLRKKNGFNLLSKKDRQILNCLIDGQYKTLMRQERDTPSFCPPAPPVCSHGKTSTNPAQNAGVD
jgi:hypothetical protein